MEIPKGCSAPLDPSAPSFLTLPAEVRNTINEYVFVLPRRPGIRIHNSDFYYDRRPYEIRADDESFADDSSEDDRVGYGSRKGRHVPRSQKNWQKRQDSEWKEAQGFRHEASLGIGLLKSCRQMYHETVGILYANNTFLVTRVGQRCDREAIRRCQASDRGDYHQINYAPIWLASLGSQMRLITKVVIDISTVCGWGCDQVELDQNLLPLLRIVWNGDLPRCSITFAHPRLLFKCPGSMHPNSTSPADIVAGTVRLNKAFAALAKDETLDLRRLSNSESLLSSVTMHRVSKDGQVQYYTGSRSVHRSFFIHPASGVVRWSAARPVNSLTDLPDDVQGMICAYAITAEDRLRLPINSARKPNFHRNVFDVSATLRESLVQAVSQYMPVVIELTAKERVSDYSDADLVRRYDARVGVREGGHRNHLVELIASQSLYSTSALPTILVQVALTRATNPTDVRINMNGLLNLKGTTHDGTEVDEICVAVELQHTRGDNVHHDTHYTTYGRLKMSMFLYLTDILDQVCPKHWKKNARQACPVFWIDGHANLVDLVAPPLGFRWSHADSLNFAHEGTTLRRLVKKIERRPDIPNSKVGCCLDRDTECVYHTWRNLKMWAKCVWRMDNARSTKQGQTLGC